MPKKKTEKKQPEEKMEKISTADFNSKVLEMAERGLTAEKIGEALRTQGIHPSEYGKISRILKAKGLYHVPEIKNLQKKLDALAAHVEKHIQDKKAMRERERVIALLRKQKQYHNI